MDCTPYPRGQSLLLTSLLACIKRLPFVELVIPVLPFRTRVTHLMNGRSRYASHTCRTCKISRVRWSFPGSAQHATLASAARSSADFDVLYRQDFENPVGFVNDGGDVNISRNVNQLFGGQPAGFTFAQAFTVETLNIGGTAAHGVGFSDPDGRGGDYALGMLSSVQNDLLALAFDVGNYEFLNFRVDISSIDLSTFGGPFVPAVGAAPRFRFSLFDNPSGLAGLGSGAPLSFAEYVGTVAPNRFTFDWTNVVAGLSTAGNTNGKVLLQIDLLDGGYASMDNFVIAAARAINDVPEIDDPPSSVPEPATLPILVTAVLLMIAARRSRSYAQ